MHEIVHPLTPDELLPSDEECLRTARVNRLLRAGSSPEAEFAARWSGEGGDYCVYCLAEGGKRVRYIGITNQSVDKRLAQHFADRQRGQNIYKENWLRSCIGRNIEVTIHVVRSGLTAKQAGLIEELLIRLLKKPFKLTNTHAGGATGYAGLSEESKLKHRVNTKIGWERAIEKQIEAFDMERGYCLIDEQDPVAGRGDDAEPKTILAARSMDTISSTELTKDSGFELAVGGEGPLWERKLTNVIRTSGFLWRTEQNYRSWAKRFAAFIAPRLPDSAGKADLEGFLNSLADQGNSRATQKQAITALFLLLQDALRIDLGEIEFRNSDRRPKKKTEILTKKQCAALFAALDDQSRLMVELMYCAGLRISELLALRVHHVDFDHDRLRIYGRNERELDRVMPLPKRLLPALRQHLVLLGNLWRADQHTPSFAGGWVPSSIAAIDPDAGRKWEWQWLFPAKTLSLDVAIGMKRRHHFGDGRLQQIVRSAARKAGLAMRVSPNVLRLSFARHLLENGVNRRIVLEVLGTGIVEEISDKPQEKE